MTTLNQFVWDRLPFPKYAVGRRRIESFAWMALELHAKGAVPEAIAIQIAHAGRHRGMGFVSMLILSAIVNQIVRLVVEWWSKKEWEPT